jgi:hypothetical protein
VYPSVEIPRPTSPLPNAERAQERFEEKLHGFEINNDAAELGDSTATDSTWAYKGFFPGCENARPVYCFEQ